MNKQVTDALKSSATFNFVNNSGALKKLALLPGIYSTLSTLTDAGAGKETIVVFNSPDNLVNAGYPVDQAADDHITGDGASVIVSGANRVKFRDFLNTVQRLGIRITRIVIQNKATGATKDDIFDQEIELAQTGLGSKGQMKFITLQEFVSVNAYDRSKIEIDLTGRELDLGPDTYMAMGIPDGANFSMQFCFEY